jgi:predicted RND superfamily exporter protein
MLEALERGILRGEGRPVLIGMLVVMVFGLVGAAQIRTYGPTREYMARDSRARLDLEAIERHFEGTTTMTLLYDGEAGSAKRLDVLTHMDRLTAMLATDPLVVRTSSLADLVKTLHETFNAEDPAPYRIPDSQELVSQLVFLGESPAFERFTDRSYSQALVVAYLTTDDSALVGPLLDRLRAWLASNPAPDGTRLLVAGGMGPTVLAVNEHTTVGKLVNMVVVLGVIFLVASIVLRSPLGGLYVVTPIFISIVMLFGTLGWTGVRLDMGSATILAVAAGIGADYAIYFIYRLREELVHAASDAEALRRTMQTSGRAILFVAASIGAGFAVMAFSKFFGLRLFGSLMPTAMLFSSLAALSFMPVLILRARPAFIFGRSDAPARMPIRAAG